MPGLADLAIGAAPLFGGALLGVATGQLKAPDVHKALIQDMDLLDRLPPEQAKRRAEFQRVIDMHIDDLIAAADRSRAARMAAASYQGSWRDIVLFVCVVLFAFIWWGVDHSRTYWLPTFIALILLSIVAAAYAFRGGLRTLRALLHRSPRQDATSSAGTSS